MRIRFWGTRGSIPTPGKNTLHYGGNTSCVELRSLSDTLLIVDGGTGIFPLGQHLLTQEHHKRKGNLLISHAHWDHIQGIPFFAPFFIKGGEWHIYGPKELSQSIQDILSAQMEHTYFPISLAQMGATIHYHDLVEGEFDIAEVNITTHYLNHTSLTCGYRFTVDGIVVVYCCDHEPYSRLSASSTEKIDERDQDYANFLLNADLVIHEAQYTFKEYLNKIGWGHSTHDYVAKICEYAHVKKLVLTHHDPLRNDDNLDVLIKELRSKYNKVELFAAHEGMEFVLRPQKEKFHKKLLHNKELEKSQIDSAISEQWVLVYVTDPEVRTLLDTVLTLDHLHVQYVEDEGDFNQALQSRHSFFIIMEHQLPQINALLLCHSIQKNKAFTDSRIMIIANEENVGNNNNKNKNKDKADLLIKPFSQSYLRSKIHAWILRMTCRWIRAAIPVDEEQRLLSLYKLKILDTPQEDRFDRITRLSVALFNMPIATITFVDKKRQWFKSCFGVDEKSSSREASFCSHVVYNREPLIIEDTFHDNRFADNPFVIDNPKIRFYAGYPLILTDGSCVGSLCVMDTRPRVFTEKNIQLLKDLRDLTLIELEM